MTLNLQDPYLAYYKQQLGHGVSVVYRGALHQRGHGIGSFLGGLFRTVTPLLKSGAKAIGKEALRTGINVLSDVVSTVPPKQAISSRMKEFTSTLKRKADDKLDRVMKGSGYKRKKLNVTPQSIERLLAVGTQKSIKGKKKPKAVKRKSKPKDIFN